jgi:hypothetical protein
VGHQKMQGRMRDAFTRVSPHPSLRDTLSPEGEGTLDQISAFLCKAHRYYTDQFNLVDSPRCFLGCATSVLVFMSFLR